MWSTVEAEIPDTGDVLQPRLSDVVAISSTDAWAVGRYQGPPGEDVAAETFPLIEHWDGVTWDMIGRSGSGR